MAPGRGGGWSSTENPSTGGGFSHEKGGARGREGVCGEWGGGAKYFFPRPKCPPRQPLRLEIVFKDQHSLLIVLCWVRAASGPFFGEQYISA